MARVKGRDVVLEMMESVEALQKTTALHATQLSELAVLAMDTSARVHGLTIHTTSLAKGFGDLSRRMDDMSTRMDDMSTRMDDMSTQLETFTAIAASLESGLIAQAEHTKLAAHTAHEQAQHLGRLSRLLGVYADGSKSRFEEIESRLVVLEKKAS